MAHILIIMEKMWVAYISSFEIAETGILEVEYIWLFI